MPLPAHGARPPRPRPLRSFPLRKNPSDRTPKARAPPCSPIFSAATRARRGGRRGKTAEVPRRRKKRAVWRVFPLVRMQHAFGPSRQAFYPTRMPHRKRMRRDNSVRRSERIQIQRPVLKELPTKRQARPSRTSFKISQNGEPIFVLFPVSQTELNSFLFSITYLRLLVNLFELKFTLNFVIYYKKKR